MSDIDTGSEVLSVQGVEKSFRSGGRTIAVLRGVDLGIRVRESTSVRGASGSGKTTLLNIIAGLESADRGLVMWGSEDAARMSPAARAERRAHWIGMVFQAFYIIPELNALDNVLMAARIAGSAGPDQRSRARDLLGRVGLGDRLRASPAHLSGGEKQRVALARALINRPALILADEPTGNLDEETADSVMQLLLEVCREENSSLILVTHNAVFASRTDHQCALRAGVIDPL
jgi:lipoprotein-releasing system ATP-binding protein